MWLVGFIFALYCPVLSAVDETVPVFSFNIDVYCAQGPTYFTLPKDQLLDQCGESRTCFLPGLKCFPLLQLYFPVVPMKGL